MQCLNSVAGDRREREKKLRATQDVGARGEKVSAVQLSLLQGSPSVRVAVALAPRRNPEEQGNGTGTRS